MDFSAPNGLPTTQQNPAYRSQQYDAEVVRSPNRLRALAVRSPFDKGVNADHSPVARLRSSVPSSNQTEAASFDATPTTLARIKVRPSGRAHRDLSKDAGTSPFAYGLDTPRTRCWPSGLDVSPWVRCVLIACVALVLLVAATSSLFQDVPTLRPVGEPCQVEYPTVEEQPADGMQHQNDPSELPLHSRISIAIVTLHDTRKTRVPGELAYLSGIEADKEVDILDVVWKNRQQYADRHGYTLIDATRFRGTERPAAWYKIKAVQAVLNDYDWVFYMESDAWITNPDVKLEYLIPAHGHGDMVIAEDVNGVNAGMWLMKNNDWSRDFLQQWWDLKEFVKDPVVSGQKSGDNDALKRLLKLHWDVLKPHIRLAQQCVFNSYLWRPSLRQWIRWIKSYSAIQRGTWKPGHFVVHLAGWDKVKALKRMQRLFLSSNGAGMVRGHQLPLPRGARPDRYDRFGRGMLNIRAHLIAHDEAWSQSVPSKFTLPRALRTEWEDLAASRTGSEMTDENSSSGSSQRQVVRHAASPGNTQGSRGSSQDLHGNQFYLDAQRQEIANLRQYNNKLRRELEEERRAHGGPAHTQQPLRQQQASHESRAAGAGATAHAPQAQHNNDPTEPHVTSLMGSQPGGHGPHVHGSEYTEIAGHQVSRGWHSQGGFVHVQPQAQHAREHHSQPQAHHTQHTQQEQQQQQRHGHDAAIAGQSNHRSMLAQTRHSEPTQMHEAAQRELQPGAHGQHQHGAEYTETLGHQMSRGWHAHEGYAHAQHPHPKHSLQDHPHQPPPPQHGQQQQRHGHQFADRQASAHHGVTPQQKHGDGPWPHATQPHVSPMHGPHAGAHGPHAHGDQDTMTPEHQMSRGRHSQDGYVHAPHSHHDQPHARRHDEHHVQAHHY